MFPGGLASTGKQDIHGEEGHAWTFRKSDPATL